MKKLLLISLLLASIASAGTCLAAASEDPGYNQAAINPMVEGLKEQMLKDEGIMALITALQEDSEVQSLLNDPALQSAVQSGDVAALISNPAFVRMLGNPRVKAIERKLDPSGGGTQ